MRTRLSFFFVLLLAAAGAYPQSTHTWVSGSGDDLFSCSYTQPCRTFSGAYNKTNTGGIISVRDTGVFGLVTISKSITIDGGGTYASIVNNGASGVTINFTSTDSYGNNVVLRGLTFYSNQTGSGVRITGTVAAHVTVSDSAFVEEGIAVDVQPGAAGTTVKLSNLDISRGGRGIYVNPPAGTALKLSVERVRVAQQSTAGLEIDDNTEGTISDSTFTTSTEGVRLDATSVHVNLMRCVLTQNSAYGLRHTVSGITTVIDECTIAGNATGVLNTGSTLLGFFNNSVVHNGIDVTGNPVQSLAQQ